MYSRPVAVPDADPLAADRLRQLAAEILLEPGRRDGVLAHCDRPRPTCASIIVRRLIPCSREPNASATTSVSRMSERYGLLEGSATTRSVRSP